MIPTEKDWLSGTSNSRFTTFDSRGTRLKALDGAIRSYHLNRNADTHAAVGNAWAEWKTNHADLFDAKGNSRNKNALLDLLAAEFSPDDLDKIKNCSMCLVKVTFQDKPIGFPANGEAIETGRIDKALLDAQGVLRMTVFRLQRADSATRTQVNNWFGDKAAVKDLLKRFEQLQDHMENKLKRNVTPLEIRWDAKDGNVASTGYKSNYIAFGPGFFDDKVTVPSWNLSGKPVPQPDYLIQAKEIIAEWDKLKDEVKLLGYLEGWLKSSGETVDDFVKANFKATSMPSFANPKAMLAALQPLGLSGGDSRADALAALQKHRAANTKRTTQMEDDAKARRIPVSASGVIIHELTHMVLNTEDLQSPLFTAKQPCYGPGLCLHLASVSPKDALNNADNYRLFAECCQFD